VMMPGISGASAAARSGPLLPSHKAAAAVASRFFWPCCGGFAAA
jgi:hypothetical protein